MYTSRLLLSNLASCLSLATLVASFPANDQNLIFSKRNATIEQSVFYGVTGAELEVKLAKLKADGYRPTSLNIHGSTKDAKYAGIWTKQSGEDFETILGANETTDNAWLDQLKSSGYVSTHVSATGSSSDALFAGVMQKLPSVANWIQVCDLDTPYVYANATESTPMIVKGVSMYGVPNERRYCILGHEDLMNYQQTMFYQTDNFKYDYAELEASETSKRHWRPVFIDMSEDLLPPYLRNAQLYSPYFVLKASKLGAPTLSFISDQAALLPSEHVDRVLQLSMAYAKDEIKYDR